MEQEIQYIKYPSHGDNVGILGSFEIKGAEFVKISKEEYESILEGHKAKRVARLEQARKDQEAQAEHRKSALAKLKILGLSEEEAQSLIG